MSQAPGAIRSYVAAGVAIGAAIARKYSAAFLLPLTLVAHLAAPGRPPRAPQWGAWTAWLLKGAIPGVVAGVTFLLLDPFVWLEFNKAVAGIGELVTGPMTGEIRAIWGSAVHSPCSLGSSGSPISSGGASGRRSRSGRS